jgi:hypothetical protein
MKKSLKLDPKTEAIARRLLMQMADKGQPDHTQQAMMLKHFNAHASGASTFSHNSLGTKLRRYGR